MFGPLTVTVIVETPNSFAAGLMVSVRVEPEPDTAMLAALFGTSVVLLEVAVTEVIEPPPTLKVN